MYESISLLTEGETITIGFNPAVGRQSDLISPKFIYLICENFQSITLDSKKATKFPLQLNQTYIYFDHNIVTVKNKKGISLECNMYYNICVVHLSGNVATSQTFRNVA